MHFVTTGAKVALGLTAAFCVAIAVELLYLHHRNATAAAAPGTMRGAYEKNALNPDDAVFLRRLRPSTLKDERELVGKDVWISAGGQMDYYKDAANHVDWKQMAGTLPGAEHLLVKGVFEQVPAASGRAMARLGPAAKYVMLAFTEPQSADPNAVFAFPVGVYRSDGYTFYSDDILFFDDPHQLYSHWGPEMWQHIDRHEAVLGMSENQAMMSMGQVIVPHGDKFGDRTVTFDNNGHPVEMEFVHNKAVRVTPEKQTP